MLGYAVKTLFVLSGAGRVVPLFSFTTVIDAPVGIPSASISLVFLIIHKIVKYFLKQWKKAKINKKKLPRSKLNSIEKILSKLSKTLIHSDIVMIILPW